jgi:hypothetical protein
MAEAEACPSNHDRLAHIWSRLGLLLCVPWASMTSMKWGAFVVAFEVPRRAGCMASMSLLDHWALGLCHLNSTLWVFGKLPVHPFLLKLGALVTLCTIACRVASFDRWEVLARFYEWSPWLWTLVEACDICAALMMACVSFLHFVVHLLVPWLLVFIKVPSLMIIIGMLAMVMPSASTEWWATFVVALPIARCARLVASMVFEQHGALCFGLPDDPLRILSKLLVDPVSFKFWALATLCILARCVASFDRWEVLAPFDEWSPWLWALVVACAADLSRLLFGLCLVGGFVATLMMACMSFLHLVVHLLVHVHHLVPILFIIYVVLALVVPVLVPILMIMIIVFSAVVPMSLILQISVVMPMEHPWALVMAIVIASCASLVASMGFQHHGALCLCLPDGLLRILSKLLVHPVSFKFGALATLCIRAGCMARLGRWEVLARFDEWSPWLWALGVACDIFAALVTTCMSLLHLVVHLLVPRLLNFITMVPVTVLVPSTVVKFLVVALVPVTVLVPSTVVKFLVVALAIRILTRFIIRVLIETHAREHYLLSLLEDVMSEGGKRILVSCDSSNSNQHNGEAETHHFCLAGQRHLKRTNS